MAKTYNDLATLKVSRGDFYYAPVGTARPTTIEGLLEPASPWKTFGHTPVDNILSLESDGGERTTLASLQKSNLREDVSALSQSFAFDLLEWTTDAYKLYFGRNAVVEADGAVQVPETAQATEIALLVVFEDGESVMGFYAAKASVLRRDNLSISNTTDLNSLPLQATALTHGSSPSSFTAIPKRIKARKATAAASRNVDGTIASIYVTDGGAGYTVAPEVTITDTGSGSGATAVAKVSNGQVTEITVTAPGSDYDEPVVTVADPA